MLKVAKDNKVPPSHMPKKILILSDMEFNVCTSNPNNEAMNMIKRMYDEENYKVPQIVFWNISSRQDNVPVRYNEKGVALVSGFSPSIMKSLLSGTLDPMKIMLKTVKSERYQLVEDTYNNK